MTIYDFITWCSRNQIRVNDEKRLMKAISDYQNLLEREHIIRNHSTDEIEIVDAPALLDFLYEIKAGWYLFSFMNNTRPPASASRNARTTKRKQLLILY